MLPHTTRCALFPYTTLFRSLPQWEAGEEATGNWGGSSTAVTTQTRHRDAAVRFAERSEEHTSELQSRGHLVCRLLPEKKKPRTGPHGHPRYTRRRNARGRYI